MLFGKMKQNLTARILSRIWRNNKNDVILFICIKLPIPISLEKTYNKNMIVTMRARNLRFEHSFVLL